MSLSFTQSNVVIPGLMTLQQLPYYVDQPELQPNLAFLDFNLAAGAASMPVDFLLKNQLILIAMLLCVSTKNTIQSLKL